MEYVKDPLTQEVDTMAIIGQLLAKLPDGGARQRVLKWAVERYASEASTQVRTDAGVKASEGADATLAVDSLNDIFGEPQGVKEELQSFAKDFRQLADEWKVAAA